MFSRPVIVSVTIDTPLEATTQRTLAMHEGHDEPTLEDIGDCIAEACYAYQSHFANSLLCHAILAKCCMDIEETADNKLNVLLEELRNAANRYLTAKERNRKQMMERLNQSPD
jgi:hypothetical protein